MKMWIAAGTLLLLVPTAAGAAKNPPLTVIPDTSVNDVDVTWDFAATPVLHGCGVSTTGTLHHYTWSEATGVPTDTVVGAGTTVYGACAITTSSSNLPFIATWHLVSGQTYRLVFYESLGSSFVLRVVAGHNLTMTVSGMPPPPPAIVGTIFGTIVVAAPKDGAGGTSVPKVWVWNPSTWSLVAATGLPTSTLTSTDHVALARGSQLGVHQIYFACVVSNHTGTLDHEFMFTKSTDGGATFSFANAIHNPAGQFDYWYGSTSISLTWDSYSELAAIGHTRVTAGPIFRPGVLFVTTSGNWIAHTPDEINGNSNGWHPRVFELVGPLPLQTRTMAVLYWNYSQKIRVLAKCAGSCYAGAAWTRVSKLFDSTTGAYQGRSAVSTNRMTGAGAVLTGQSVFFGASKEPVLFTLRGDQVQTSIVDDEAGTITSAPRIVGNGQIAWAVYRKDEGWGTRKLWAKLYSHATSSWGQEVPLIQDDWMYDFDAVFVDDGSYEGKLYVVWANSNNQLWYLRRALGANTSASFGENPNGSPGRVLRAAIRGDPEAAGGQLVVVSPEGPYAGVRARVWERSGASWTDLGMALSSSYSSTPESLAVAISSSGERLVAGALNAGGGTFDLQYSQCTGSPCTWSTNQYFSGNWSNGGMAAAYGPDGESIFIVGKYPDPYGYGRTSLQLWQRSPQEMSFKIDSVASHDVGINPSIAVSAANDVRIVHYDATAARLRLVHLARAIPNNDALDTLIDARELSTVVVTADVRMNFDTSGEGFVWVGALSGSHQLRALVEPPVQ